MTDNLTKDRKYIRLDRLLSGLNPECLTMTVERFVSTISHHSTTAQSRLALRRRANRCGYILRDNPKDRLRLTRRDNPASRKQFGTYGEIEEFLGETDRT